MQLGLGGDKFGQFRKFGQEGSLKVASRCLHALRHVLKLSSLLKELLGSRKNVVKQVWLGFKDLAVEQIRCMPVVRVISFSLIRKIQATICVRQKLTEGWLLQIAAE